MAAITIRTQILDGNLGEGWNDNFQAAEALADFTRAIWEEDTKGLREAGHEIEIEIEVRRNTTGYIGEIQVDCDDYELSRAAECAITPESYIWDKFCSSEEAEGLY